jgi:hypothetical protein
MSLAYEPYADLAGVVEQEARKEGCAQGMRHGKYLFPQQ